MGNVAGLVGTAHPEPFGQDLASEEVFHQCMPGWLDEEATGGPFDTVVLDEAQDLTDLWIYALAGLLAERSRLHAFAHTEQDLFGARAPVEELAEATYRLRESFRSTRHISQAAADFLEVLDGQAEPVESVAGEGADVRYVRAPAEHVPARTREQAKHLLRHDRFAPGEVAALTLFANPHKGDAAAVAASEEAGELVETIVHRHSDEQGAGEVVRDVRTPDHLGRNRRPDGGSGAARRSPALPITPSERSS